MAPGPSYWKAVDVVAPGGGVYQLFECGTDRGYCKSVLSADGTGVLFDGATEDHRDDYAMAPPPAAKGQSGAALARKANQALATALRPYQENMQQLLGRKDLGVVLIMDEHGCRLGVGSDGPRTRTYRNRPLWLLMLRHILMPWKRD